MSSEIDPLKNRLDNYAFSIRMVQILNRHGLKTVGDLAELSDAQIRALGIRGSMFLDVKSLFADLGISRAS